MNVKKASSLALLALTVFLGSKISAESVFYSESLDDGTLSIEFSASGGSIKADKRISRPCYYESIPVRRSIEITSSSIRKVEMTKMRAKWAIIVRFKKGWFNILTNASNEEHYTEIVETCSGVRRVRKAGTTLFFPFLTEVKALEVLEFFESEVSSRG